MQVSGSGFLLRWDNVVNRLNGQPDPCGYNVHFWLVIHGTFV